MSSKSRNLSQTSDETNKNITSVVAANNELQKLVDNVQSKVNTLRHEKVEESKAKEALFKPITQPLKEISQSLSVPAVKTETLFEDLADQKLYKFTGANLNDFPFNITPSKIKLKKKDKTNENNNPFFSVPSTIKKEKPWEKTLQEEMFGTNLNSSPFLRSQSNITNFNLLNDFNTHAESSSGRSSLGESKKRLSVNLADFNNDSIDEDDDDDDINDNDIDDNDQDETEEEEFTPEMVKFKSTAKYLGVNQVLDPKTKTVSYHLKESNIPGELNFDFDRKKLIINGTDEYPLTRKLWQLLTTDRATQHFIDGLNEQEKDTYFKIIRKHYNLENFTYYQKRNKKYREIILPRLMHFLTLAGTEGRGMSNKKYLNSLGLKRLIPKNKPVFVYWNNIEELIARLRKLVASKYAGNTSVEEENEISSIIEELREEKIIA